MARFSTNISMMFCERPLLDRFAAARDAGFSAVEIQFPYDTPVDDLVAAREDAGVAIAVFNIPVGDMLSGGPGLAAMPGREDQFRAAVEEAVRYAEALQPRNVNVLSGWPPVTLDRAACLGALATNLKVAAETMAPLGVRVVVEAVNTRDRPGFFLTTTAQALGAIERADHPNLALEYDVYHMHIMEGDLVPTLTREIGRIGHIQFADAPGRHEPGTGDIDFAAVFAAIDATDYDGWVGAEYAPSRRTEDTLAWMRG